MSNLCLVTGANGHLGNNLVRTLLSKGERVRAGVRNTDYHKPFEGLDCELVYTEMQDKQAMIAALKNVDVLYHVAAVFKHWSKNPEAEIVRPNLIGTEVVLKAAAEAKVKKVIYVSSVAAIGHDGTPLNENSWNTENTNAYYRSKIQAEKRAWELAKEYGLWMVAALPSAMIGPHAENLTDTMKFIDSIRNKSLPFNPNFFFNFVDVRDVSEALYAAEKLGEAGQRYILANNNSSSFEDIITAANTIKKDYKIPPAIPKWLLFILAKAMELMSKITGKPAELITSQVRLFHGVKQEYDISRSRKALAYSPRSPMQTLKEAFAYLEQRDIKRRINLL